jgi:hypothetical protein
MFFIYVLRLPCIFHFVFGWYFDCGFDFALGFVFLTLFVWLILRLVHEKIKERVCLILIRLRVT